MIWLVLGLIVAAWWWWLMLGDMLPATGGGGGSSLPSGPPLTQWGWPDTDEEWLARTVWGEAANDIDGPTLIIDVILNRMRARGKSARAVVLEPFQFSTWLPYTHPDHPAVTPAMRQNLARVVALEQPARFTKYRQWARDALAGRWVQTLPPHVQHYAERAAWEAFWQRPDPRHWWYQYREYEGAPRNLTHVFLVPR